jgi:hypothetical protein
MKTHVLRISKTFPSYHPKRGQPTHFRGKIELEDKIHTVRENYEFWKKRLDEVNAGKAILSVRQWIDKPYKQPGDETMFEMDKVKYETFELSELGMIRVGGRMLYIEEHSMMASNDGLTQQDFYDWFKLGRKVIPLGIVIHFTDFIYNG